MIPTDFQNTYLSTALQVSAGTGIDPYALLAQWANETDWGNVVVGNNLGNIRCSSTTFCQYATLDDFAAACIYTFHNGYYAAVLAAVGAPAQLAAIVASPWSSGHYGGSLEGFYSQLGGTVTAILRHTSNGAEYLVDASGKRPITAAEAAALGAAGGYNVVNADAALDQIRDSVDMTTILAAIKAIPSGSGGVTDLTPVLAAIADLKAHPAMVVDPSVLTIVTRIENALKGGLPTA